MISGKTIAGVVGACVGLVVVVVMRMVAVTAVVGAVLVRGGKVVDGTVTDGVLVAFGGAFGVVVSDSGNRMPPDGTSPVGWHGLGSQPPLHTSTLQLVKTCILSGKANADTGDHLTVLPAYGPLVERS